MNPDLVNTVEFQEFLRLSQEHCHLITVEKKLATVGTDVSWLLKNIIESRNNLFTKACEKLGQFVFKYGDTVKCSDIDNHLESLQSGGCIVRLLARQSHVPRGCRLVYRDSPRKYQIWVVMTTNLGYLQKESQRLGCNWKNVDERQKMRSKLDESGFMVVSDDSAEKRQEMAREVAENGDGYLEFTRHK